AAAPVAARTVRRLTAGMVAATERMRDMARSPRVATRRQWSRVVSLSRTTRSLWMLGTGNDLHVNETATRNADHRTWILGHPVRSRPLVGLPGGGHSAFIFLGREGSSQHSETVVSLRQSPSPAPPPA